MRREYSTQRLNKARRFRKNPSAAESIAWELLRRKQTGFTFRREHAMGPFVLDFYCAEAKLALELDGEQHKPLRDKLRDEWFLEHGIVTMRVPNRDFFFLDENVSFWLSDMVKLCEARTGRKAFPELESLDEG